MAIILVIVKRKKTSDPVQIFVQSCPPAHVLDKEVEGAGGEAVQVFTKLKLALVGFGCGLDQVWIKLALIRFGWERTIESSPSLTAQLPKALRSVALRMGRLTYDIVCFPS